MAKIKVLDPTTTESLEKSLLQTGEDIADTVFLRSSDATLPCIVYEDHIQRSGADGENLMTTHSIIINRYSEDGAKNPILDKMLDKTGVNFTYIKYYIQSDEIVQETYSLDDIIIRD